LHGAAGLGVMDDLRSKDVIAHCAQQQQQHS